MHALFFTAYNDGNGHKLHVVECLKRSGYTVTIRTNPLQWAEMPDFLTLLSKVDLVMIWNGAEPGCTWLKKLCANYGKRFLVAERGLLPQSGFWHLDTAGIVGESSLCGDLSWVTPAMLSNYDAYREQYFGSKGYRYAGKGGYVLCPMQLWWDTAIYLHSPFLRMEDFLRHVRTSTDLPIIATPHPLQPRFAPDVQGVTVERDKPTMELAQRAEKVIGITSTILLEIAALFDGNAQVSALGRCPLNHHGHEIRKLLAACVDRQIPITEMDINRRIHSLLK